MVGLLITYGIGSQTLHDAVLFTFNVLKKVGLSNLNSKTVANLIVRADERGVWSHGIVRLSAYVKRIEKKSAKINPILKFKKTSVKIPDTISST